MPMKNSIFKVKIDNYKRKKLSKIIEGISKRGEKFSKLPICFATLNPEILLKANNDEEYAEILNKFELKVVDGFGISFCSFFSKVRVGQRIAGADLAEIILKEAMKNELKTAFIIKKDGLSSKEEIISFLIEKFGKKKCAFCKIYSTSEIGQGSLKIEKDTQVLLVGLGAPTQEIFIQKIKEILPKLRIAIGVGGTFDYWTNKQRRAPKFMRILGMEWFWRLLMFGKYSKKKTRVKRIFEAIFIFPLKYIRNSSK
jgi:N-acetylglucosaminyldiphosphoundecaprenol N-acetyl-beta-D-mannosaminyltransferase